MKDIERGTCRSCARDIVWGMTPAGKRMPLDPDPSPDGNLWIDEGVIMSTKVDPPDGAPRYLSHFVTCPDAKRWRER